MTGISNAKIAWFTLAALLLGMTQAQAQLVPGHRVISPGLPSANGVPTIVLRQPSGDTLARERLLRNQITRDRIGARYVRPEIPRAATTFDDAIRAQSGRPELDPGRAGAFARSGPTAIGGSSVARP